MDRRFFVAWVTVFVAWMAGSYLAHGALLHADYEKLAGAFRTPAEAQQLFPFMILAHVIVAGAFVWIYARGVEAKPWLGQGVRYGIAIAALAVIPTYLIYYVVQPIPGALAIKQIVLDTIVVLVLGAIVAFIYRRSVPSTA
jgi:hypothetical protein